MRQTGVRILSDTPIRSGYLEALGGVTLHSGPFARVETGYRPEPGLAIYGVAEWNRIEPWAGLGLRFEF